MDHRDQRDGFGLDRSRRDLLGAIAVAAASLVIAPRRAQADDGEPSEAPVLRDPEVPVTGNLKGDISIVEWFDYQLRQVVQDDGKVRLVLKDWPILGPVSVVAARMALASKFQDKYLEAHDAMMGVNSRLTEARISELLADAGVDIDRARRDLDANAKTIDAILARNADQATAFSFRGTPAFIVGKFRVPGVLTMVQFGQVIADARKANMGR